MTLVPYVRRSTGLLVRGSPEAVAQFMERVMTEPECAAFVSESVGRGIFDFAPSSGLNVQLWPHSTEVIR